MNVGVTYISCGIQTISSASIQDDPPDQETFERTLGRYRSAILLANPDKTKKKAIRFLEKNGFGLLHDLGSTLLMIKHVTKQERIHNRALAMPGFPYDGRD